MDAGINELLDLLHSIPQLIPYKYDKEKNDIVISREYGLMEYRKHFKFLSNGYKKIISENKKLLDNVRTIRNKYEHQLHKAEVRCNFSGGNDGFKYEFLIKNKIIEICSRELIILYKDLNIMFSRLVSEVVKWANENSKGNYPITGKLSRFDFLDFNTIYESELLPQIGTILFDF